MALPIRPDVDPFAALVEAVAAEVVASIRVPSLDEARAACNEVGIRKAREALSIALGAIGLAQEEYREAQAVQRLAQEAHDQAVSDADWELDGRFVIESNKHWLTTSCEPCLGTGIVNPHPVNAVNRGPEEACTACDGKGSTRRSLTADERKAWKANEARKMPAVAAAAAALYRAEEDTAAARDGVTFAGHRFSAARHDLDAAVAELNALAVALTVR